MNKQSAIKEIAESVRKKHPWNIAQEKYLALFNILPKEFLEERIHFDNLLLKIESFKLCQLNLSEVKVNIKLTLDELVQWELQLDKWKDEVNIHNIYPSDIKKYLKDN